MHCHMLFGVDDGARDEGMMRAMLDMAYADGTRAICLTPHYHPGYYGDNGAQTDAAFRAASEYAAARYPDLRLALGNELHYDGGAPEWLRSGDARTLNGSRYVLADFHDGETAFTIERAMTQLLSLGCTPVLAHVERYRALHGKLRLVEQMMSRGVLMQLDAQSILGDDGAGMRRMAHALLRRGMADLVASDGHDPVRRPPLLGACESLIAHKYGEENADLLFRRNPGLIWNDRTVR